MQEAEADPDVYVCVLALMLDWWSCTGQTAILKLQLDW